MIPKKPKNSPETAVKLTHRLLSDFVMQISVSKDETEAYLRIDDYGATYDPVIAYRDLLALIEETVTEGLEREFLDEELPKIVAKRIPFMQRIIARGTPAEYGQDFRIEYKVGRPSRDQVVRQDGSVDFKNRNLFKSVEVKEIILTKYPPTQGKPGMSVFGRPIIPPTTKDINLVPGKNVVLEDQEKKQVLIATSQGQVIMTEGTNSLTVKIAPVLEILGNVDFNTGNINFKGSVIIKGSILSGFSVVATGNVEVYGTLGSEARLTSGADIVVGKGVLGSGKNDDSEGVRCFGNFQALYAENVRIICDGDVFLRSALNSTIMSNGSLYVEKNLVGGEATIFKGVEAFEIGNDVLLKTIVRCGVSYTIQHRLNLIVKILLDMKKIQEKTEKDLEFVSRKGDQLLPEKKEKLVASLETRKNSLKDQVFKLEMKKADLALEILEQNYATVSGQRVFPNTVIFLRCREHIVEREMTAVTFYQKLPDEIVFFRPYDPIKNKSDGKKPTGKR